MDNWAFEPSLNEAAPAQPDISERPQDNRDAAVHLLYQEVLRLREEIAAKVAERDEEVGQLREALRRQVERVTAMACAEEIVRRAGQRQMGAAANSGPIPVQRPELNSNRPKPHRKPPDGWRVINGGAAQAIVLVAAGVVAIVLLAFAGGAVAVPGRLSSHAQAATVPHPRLYVPPEHWANAQPPPLLDAPAPARHHHCHHGWHVVLVADVKRCRKDDDDGSRTVTPARPAQPSASPSPSTSSAPPPSPSPSPTPTVPDSSPAASPPPSPAPTPSVAVAPNSPAAGQ